MIFESQRALMPKSQLNTASMLSRLPENIVTTKTQIVPLNKEKIFRLEITQKHSEFGQRDTNQYIRFLQSITTKSQVDLINKFDSMVVDRVREIDTEVISNPGD
jgi:DNA topoisomerase VI subunit A